MGNIRLRMAGTGNAFAKTFFNNNAMIESPNHRFMIDFGQTAPLSLHQMNIPLNQVNDVLITHLHSDHHGGLEELAFQSMFRYGHDNGKIRLWIAHDLVGPLWENTLKGGLSFGNGGTVTLDSYFEVRLMEEGRTYSITDELSVELVSTPHIPGKPNYALFINGDIFYSGDTVFNRPLLDHAIRDRKCRILLHECQLEGEGAVHTELAELLTLPEDVQARIKLMHYEDVMPNYIGKTGAMQFLEQHRYYDL